MKKLLLLVPGVLLSTMSISQTATKIVNDQDSTVVMSKKLVGYMIEDLIKSDADKQAIQLLEQNLTFKDGIIAQKDDIIGRHDASMKAKNDLIREYESNEKDMVIAMDKLKNDLNKKKQGSKDMKPLIKYKDGSKGVSLAFSRGEKDPKGGLTQKGVDKYNRATGGNLKMAVTTPPSKLKPGSKAANRRKSFCARMSGVKGPMEKNGKPTRKALALRKWNC